MMSAPVGVIAGSGDLPEIVAQKLREKGNKIVVCSITPDRNGELENKSDVYFSVSPPEFGSVPDRLRSHGVKKLLMVGDVDKTQLYNQEKIEEADETVKDELKQLKNKGDQKIIQVAARLLRLKGLKVIGVNEVLEDYLTPTGHVAGPEARQEELLTLSVIENIAIKLADYEVGQAVIGKKQSVVAVEAAEGTDRLIRRAGELAGNNCVMLKIARSDQDSRFDVPVVGKDTVEELAKIGASVLALEAGETLLVQPAECARIAEESGITILGWERKNRGWRRIFQWLK